MIEEQSTLNVILEELKMISSQLKRRELIGQIEHLIECCRRTREEICHNSNEVAVLLNLQEDCNEARG